MFVSLFGAIGFMLLTFWKRKSYPTNLLFLSCFTALEAYSISVITSFYDSRIVVEALIFTLAIFVALTIFACQSKYDFTSWMPYLFGGVWVLIIFGEFILILALTILSLTSLQASCLPFSHTTARLSLAMVL